LASEAKTAARPSSYCQRTSSDLLVDREDCLGRGFGDESHIAAQGRRSVHADAREDLGLLDYDRRDRLLDRGRASMLHDVFEQDLLESRRIVQEMGFALANEAIFSRYAG